MSKVIEDEIKNCKLILRDLKTQLIRAYEEQRGFNVGEEVTYTGYAIPQAFRVWGHTKEHIILKKGGMTLNVIKGNWKKIKKY